MRKTDSCLCEYKGADQLCSYCAFVFATWIVQSLLLLNPIFQASSLFSQTYEPISVRPDRNPKTGFLAQDHVSCSAAHIKQLCEPIPDCS